MIRHIVLFQAADGTPQTTLDEAARRLEALVGVVPGLRSMSAGANGLDLEGNYDLALVADLDDAEALAGYAVHPAHVEVAELIGTFKTGRAAVDIAL
ncbi:Dabb family protein [Microbacterium sp. gxy059]|uniref:Dabb family protein n=1 Tax=Microbacterium sp. gxy059 TaxID=2957199 RepID=UPI003D993760